MKEETAFGLVKQLRKAGHDVVIEDQPNMCKQAQTPGQFYSAIVGAYDDAGGWCEVLHRCHPGGAAGRSRPVHHRNPWEQVAVFPFVIIPGVVRGDVMRDQIYAGYKINLNSLLSSRIQTRFPRSKRRRIQRKWAKRDANYVSMPDTQIYVMEQTKTMVMHPAIWAKLEKELKPCDTHGAFTAQSSVYMPFMEIPMTPVLPTLSMSNRILFF